MSVTSRGSARFSTLAQLLAWRSLLWLTMTCNEGSWHRIISSAKHRWPYLWHYIFVESGEAFIVEGNEHTHIQAISMNGLHSQIRTLSKNLLLLPQYKVRKNKTFLLFVLRKIVTFSNVWSLNFLRKHVFFNKKIFYGKMSLKNLKTCRKCYENLQPQMSELQF